jgi:hypothetical protein
VQTIPTSLTGEIVTIAITGVRIPTTRTSFAGVFGLNGDHTKTFAFGFVADELLKLVEGPSVEVGALLLAEPAPISDALQVFNRNRRVACPFSKGDDPLADDMIRILHKPRFSSRQPFQRPANAPSRTLCLPLLETGADFGVSLPDVFDVTTAEESGTLPIGGDGKKVDALVNSYNGIVGVGDGFDFTPERKSQIDFSPADKQPPVSKDPIGQLRTPSTYAFRV